MRCFDLASLLAGALALAVTSCDLQTPSTSCHDDSDCPEGFQCDDSAMICTGRPADSGTSGRDAGVRDTDPLDRTVADSAPRDTSVADSGSSDLSVADSAAPDSAIPDSAAPDSAIPDSAAPDSAAPDSFDPCALVDCPAGSVCEVAGGIASCVCPPGAPDADNDGTPDACDLCTDTDGDGYGDLVFPVSTCAADNCPSLANPGQADSDTDGIGDLCDSCTDGDQDGFGDPGFALNTCPPDNCPELYNASQLDSDWDGLGDVCDGSPNAASLIFITHVAPAASGSYTALVSDGDELWFFRRDDGRLFRSSDGSDGSWTAVSPATSMGPTTGPQDLFDGAMAHDPDGDRLVVSRWMDSELPGEYSWDRSRLATYDIGSDTWTLCVDGEFLNAPTNGFVTIGGYLFGAQHAGGWPIRRVTLSSLPDHDQDSSALSGLTGPDPGWFSRVVKLAVAGSQIYGIKNDWQDRSAAPTISDGDRLFRFDPDDYVNASATPVTDLGQLPFEPGDGAAVVALPAGWAGLGPAGGLMVIAGESPSLQEGWGPNSDLYFIFDIAGATRWTTAQLPAAIGGGTSACFHNGAVFIKAASSAGDTTLWELRPTP